MTQLYPINVKLSKTKKIIFLKLTIKGNNCHKAYK